MLAAPCSPPGRWNSRAQAFLALMLRRDPLWLLEGLECRLPGAALVCAPRCWGQGDHFLGDRAIWWI